MLSYTKTISGIAWTISLVGDSSLVITEKNISNHMAGLVSSLRPQSWILNLIPSAEKLLIDINLEKISPISLVVFKEYVELIFNLIAEATKSGPSTKPTTHVIPVCFDESLGLDLAAVCQELTISKEELIASITEKEHPVLFMGFTPGFAYLSSPLNGPVSRLTTPRLKVPAGSLALAGTQMGIYPIESPGGWQIIGQTSKCMIKESHGKIVSLRAGDLVKYVEVSLAEWEARCEPF